MAGVERGKPKHDTHDVVHHGNYDAQEKNKKHDSTSQ